MKVNLSQMVKNLCTNQNMTLKDLANKMGIASAPIILNLQCRQKTNAKVLFLKRA